MMERKTEHRMISISGVRGTIPEGLNAESLTRFALAFGTWLKRESPAKNRVVLGRDNRPTGRMVRSLVEGSLTSLGLDVMDLGLIPTPSVKAAVDHFRAGGGIMLSASHNPVNWNAYKFIGPRGDFLTEPQLEEVLKIYQQSDFDYADWSALGQRERVKKFGETHISQVISACPAPLVKKIRKAGFRVAVDAVGGAGSDILPKFLKKLGCKVYSIHCKESADFPRPPEPVPSALKDLAALVKKKKCHIGFAVDPDADRLALITEKGEPAGEEWTLPLALLSVLADRPGDVVVNLSSSALNDEIAKKFKRQLHRSAVGEANVVALMRETEAALGGEGNGGVIDPKISSYGRDSLAGMVHVLGALVHARQPLSKIIAGYPPYKIVKQAYPVNPDLVLADLAREVEEEMAGTQGPPVDRSAEDGIRLDWKPGWVHLRASNTEPIVRVIFEFRDKEFGSQMESFFERRLGAN